MKNQLRVFLLGIGIFTAAVTAPSCNKIGPAKGNVKVVDENNNPISGATVTLHAEEIQTPRQTNSSSKQTDAGGYAQFEFKNEAIWTIEAFHVITTSDSLGTYNDTIYGKGLLRLEKDKTVEETVTVK